MPELTANYEAKGMGEDGLLECARGERSEIWVRAPNILKGYWRKVRGRSISHHLTMEVLGPC